VQIWEEIKPFKEAPAVAGTAEEADAGKYSAREAAADKNSNEPDKQAEEQSEIALSKEADAIVGAAVASPRSVAKEDKPQVQKDAMQDFGSLIADEVAALKDKKQHAFRFHDTGLKTIVFLEMPFATKDAGPCQVRLETKNLIVWDLHVHLGRRLQYSRSSWAHSSLFLFQTGEYRCIVVDSCMQGTNVWIFH
jgi:hypothetical protein